MGLKYIMLNMVCIDIIRKHFLYCLTSAKEAMKCHHECLYNPHSIIQGNNNICSVLSNCFGIISHFCLFSKSKFVYNSYYLHFFFIQVRISALMYRSSSGISKKKIKKKTSFPPICVYYNNFSSLDEIKHQ